MAHTFNTPDRHPSATTSQDATRPFGAEFLEELPIVQAPFGGTKATTACTGLQTGGGDDPNAESDCC